jgi:hypothetical protein
MKTLAKRNIDYALFSLDGIFNFQLDEGEVAADLINAKHNIPIHLKSGALFDKERALMWKAKNKIIVEPNEEIVLSND